MSYDPRSNAERAVELMEQRRAARRDHAHSLAAAFFAYLAEEFGEEVAREAWLVTSEANKRRRGKPVTDEKKRQDRLAVAMDDFNRELGMSAEQSAERVGEALDIGGDEPRDVRRTLDRIRARTRPTPIPE